MTNLLTLQGIQPEQVVQNYTSRSLNHLSNYELLEQAIEIVATPKIEPDSFGLHTPLELLARYRLLPYVRQEMLSLARMQIVATVSCFEFGGKLADMPALTVTFPNLFLAKSDLLNALNNGDLNRAETVFLWLLHNYNGNVIQWLLEESLLLALSGAAHGNILFGLLSTLGTSFSKAVSLARLFIRETAKHPSLKFSWISTIENSLKSEEQPLTPDGLSQELVRILFKVKYIGKPQESGIAPIMLQAEQAGLPQKFIGSLIQEKVNSPDWGYSALSSAMQVAALSMLQEPTKHAKYGWTHCMTLPQSIWLLYPRYTNKIMAVQTALAYVIGFRSAIGQTSLVPTVEYSPTKLSIEDALNSSPELAAATIWNALDRELPSMVTQLATEAAIRNDAHLVKYTLACIDLAKQDRIHSRLYLSAAAYLCAIWVIEQPFDTIQKHLHIGRD